MKIALSARPTRRELRDALTVLRAFSAIGDDEASEQHARVSEMLRALYPRVAPADDAPSGVRRPRRSKRRLIEPEDTLRTCPQCDGIGTLRYTYTRPIEHVHEATPAPVVAGRACGRSVDRPLPTPRGHAHPGPCDLRAGDARPAHFVVGPVNLQPTPDIHVRTETSIGDGACWRCSGEGVISDMAHEHDPARTLLNGRVVKRPGRVPGDDWRAIRGEWARQTGVSPRTCRGVHHVHQRGQVGTRPIGPARPEETEEQRRWYGAGTPEPHFDAIDISAALEGRAIRAARRPQDAPENAPRGRHLAKRSRRDVDTLTPRQQKRVRQEDRARALQRAVASRRTDLPARRRPTPQWLKDLALSCGVDLDALARQAGTPNASRPIVEDARIVEAIRRGDLPPDPVITPDPDVDDEAPGWDVQHAGKRAIRRVHVGRAIVARPGGRVEWASEAITLVYADGSIETYHPDDM